MTHVLLPKHLLIGAGCRKDLAALVAQLGCERPLVISDPTMERLGVVADCCAGIADCATFCETVPEPTLSSLQPGLEAIAAHDADCLIAIGGGSPIDSAKALALLAELGGTIRDYAFPAPCDRDGLPVIAVPTTAGTGSEVTQVMVITDDSQEPNEKLMCKGPAIQPVAAVVDAELSYSLPARITADTGLDALTHALEAYVSTKANAYSDQQALAALRLIGPNLKTAYTDGGNAAAREAMMLGATLAGVAFSNASVAAIHGLSRPIGAFFHVPHGLSNAMLLPAVTAFSLAAAPARYAAAGRALGVADSADDRLAGQQLVSALKRLCADLAVPGPKAFGIAEADWNNAVVEMAKQAIASGSPNCNPRIPTHDDCIQLYQTIWEDNL